MVTTSQFDQEEGIHNNQACSWQKTGKVLEGNHARDWMKGVVFES